MKSAHNEALVPDANCRCASFAPHNFVVSRRGDSHEILHLHFRYRMAMLHAQIVQSTDHTREASSGFDVKILKGHIKESRGIPQNSLTRLDGVIRRLLTLTL